MTPLTFTILSLALAFAPAHAEPAQGSGPLVASVAVENRFVASGTLLETGRTAAGITILTMKIEKVQAVEGFPNMGSEYRGRTVEIFSEIGVPAEIQAGKQVTLILRLSGDERHQALFLVEVIHGSAP